MESVHSCHVSITHNRINFKYDEKGSTKKELV